jgi:predicted TIM-barrel fold metal-dependent hydrolase
MYPLYQAAQDLDIPVLIHTGSSVFKGTRMKYGDPLHLDDVAVDFPRLNLVMAHADGGSGMTAPFFFPSCIPTSSWRFRACRPPN